MNTRVAGKDTSVFDIFKIGIGPSSSHTMGPWKACRSYMDEMSEVLPRVTRVQVVLYGSLAKTGAGHGTDKAIQLGLRGEDPEEIDPEAIDGLLERIARSKHLSLLGEHRVPFDPKADIIYRREETLPGHANALTIRVQQQEESWQEATYYSVGGGFIVKEGEDEEGTSHSAKRVPYPCSTGQELLQHCQKEEVPISEIVRRNERLWRTDAAINERLDAIWSVMKNCVYRGCHSEGELPGGLDVKRRASRLRQRLLTRTGAREALVAEGRFAGKPSTGGQSGTRNGAATKSSTDAGYTLADYDPDEWIEAIRTAPSDFQDTLRWISSFAIAVNEENAAFGRVVTAPTNGAAGVIPAVLLYYVCFCDGDRDGILRFLLTAGQVGILFKDRATISAAMGGCQAEIGVSSAMASAGLTECLGGSPEQALMAAEIAMEHHLGLTCDPVGGLVQIPCIERNSMGAVKAVTACSVALDSDPSHAKVSLDDVIETMWETAQDMNSKYKETSEGGLAVQIPVNVPEC